MCCLCDLVLLRSNSGTTVACFPVFVVLCALGVNVGDDASVRSTSPSASSSHQVRGSIYHTYNFQLTVPSSRIERLLDPTTYIYASHMKPQTAMFLHIPANHVLLCYLIAAQPLLSMHARIISHVILLLL